MWKIAVTVLSMVVSGVVTFYVSALVVLEMGGKLYAQQHPLLVFGPTVIGFLVPGVVVWYLDQMRIKSAWKVAGTLASMAASGIAMFILTMFINWQVLHALLSDNVFFIALLLGHALTAIAVLAPGVIVWRSHKRGTTDDRSP
jgi:hypothetical protein